MLIIKVSGDESFDEETSQFIYGEEAVLCFEHSLVSLSKWESKYKVPFLGNADKTPEQLFDYLRFMLIDESGIEMLSSLNTQNISDINEYIQSSESATTFQDMSQTKGRGRSEVITSELIYYWMVAFNIPFECENWHLNRLFALIQICNIKNSPEKKMSKRDIATRNSTLNAQRRQQLNTTG